jgi:beta-galactosidase
LYKSYWKTDETTIHILPHWNWENRIGQNVPVFVYTNGDAAELFLNGKSLGKRSKNPKSKNAIERFRLMWNEVVYQPGTLKVVVYKEGQILGEKTLKTAEKPTQIRLSPDKKTLKADGNDLSYVLIEALDSEGNLCPLADAKIDIQVSGEGKLKAVGNGNPQSFEPFHSQTVQLFYGKAMLIVGSEMKTGTVKINATSKDLKGENVVLKVE